MLVFRDNTGKHGFIIFVGNHEWYPLDHHLSLYATINNLGFWAAARHQSLLTWETPSLQEAELQEEPRKSQWTDSIINPGGTPKAGKPHLAESPEVNTQGEPDSTPSQSVQSHLNLECNILNATNRSLKSSISTCQTTKPWDFIIHLSPLFFELALSTFSRSKAPWRRY